MIDAFFRLILRLVLFAAAVIFTLSLLTALVVMLIGWMLRSLWYRLTGRPAPARVIRIDPGAVWRRAWRPERSGSGPRGRRAADEDVTDVTDVTPRS